MRLCFQLIADRAGIATKECRFMFGDHALQSVGINQFEIGDVTYDLPSRPLTGNGYRVQLRCSHRVSPADVLVTTMDCDLDTTVPDWIIEHPQVQAVFDELGIDTSNIRHSKTMQDLAVDRRSGGQTSPRIKREPWPSPTLNLAK